MIRQLLRERRLGQSSPKLLKTPGRGCTAADTPSYTNERRDLSSSLSFQQDAVYERHKGTYDICRTSTVGRCKWDDEHRRDASDNEISCHCV
jgi:hypothetical protein